MNPKLSLLHPYPFEKLAQLKQGCTPPVELEHIALSIGEPKHPAPQFVLDSLSENMHGLSSYPITKGSLALRTAICSWLQKRFKLKASSLDPEQHCLPVNGTREALFAFAQACIDTEQSEPLVIMPNPFYQIYEGASLLAGAEPYYLDCLAENDFIPDYDSVSAETWQRCQLLFICSPGNPTGAVMDSETLGKLIALADKYDFIIASDECYSELYFDEDCPPQGLLQTCAELGRDDFSRCVVFHSLSKRSNLPGLRSGFVAGDAALIKPFLLYRTYHGCAMPVQHQLASVQAWQDEEHVRENRELYRQKFAAVLAILDGTLEVQQPDASFYLWAKTPGCEQAFARKLFDEQNITVLPGSFLSRETKGHNPGAGYIRMALVASPEECTEAAERIKRCLLS